MVEFALVLPLLIVVMLGLIETGKADVHLQRCLYFGA